MSIIHRNNQKPAVAAGWKLTGSLLLLTLCSLFVSAQGSNFLPRSRLITQLPFTTFTGGVVVIKVELEGHPDTLNFIMDTGSGGISLDSTTCDQMKIIATPTDRYIIGIGGARKVKFIYNQGVKIGSLQVDSLNLHVSDYSILSSVYGDRIDGIIGFSFFSRYLVYIDYDSNLVSIYSKGSIKYPKGGFFLKPSIVNIPVISAILRDERGSHSRFYFDTGAGLCLLLSTDFTNDSSIFPPGKRMWPTQAQGMGGKANMKITTIKEFRLGPYRFKNIPTHVFNDEFNITSYPYLAGLIGNDLLRRFNLILNYEKKTFYLIPNTHFREGFDYAYTGLALYWTDGAIRVGDVMKDSPAEQAGLKVDDVVIGVNNNMSQNLQLYKSMMQDVGSKIKFLISRPEGMVELNMKIRSIL